jgi:hypothetical protein
VEADAEAVGRRIGGHKLLQACCTVDSSPWHRDMREHSVAAEESAHNDHKSLSHSEAGVDTEGSVANNDRIGVDVVVGVEDAEAEAKLTDTGNDMEVVEADAWDDVWEALIEVGEPNNDGVDVEMDEECGGLAGRDGVEVEAAVDRTYGVVAAAEDSRGQMGEAEGRWPWSGHAHTR